MRIKRFLRTTVLAAMVGTCFQFFGCLGGGNFWTRAFWAGVGATGFEVVSQDPAFQNLFQGDNSAGGTNAALGVAG